jgi:hypothetical protein
MAVLLPWNSLSTPPEGVMLDGGVMRGTPHHAVPERVFLITCGALMRDVHLCLERHGWWHVDTECLPARYHVRPELIGPALLARARVATARGYGRVAALFGDCGSAGAIAHFCAEEDIAVAALPHCGAMYDPRLAATEPGEDGCFFVTDFLLRHFETLVWLPLRLDTHPELVEVMFAPYDRVVHLAQVDDPALDKAALRVAVRLNMPLERRPAPPDRLSAVLAGLVGDPTPAATRGS